MKETFKHSRKTESGVSLKGHMDPAAFIYKFDVRQVVADVRQPARPHRDVNCPTLCVVAVDRSANGSIECLAAETAVDFNRYAKMFA